MGVLGGIASGAIVGLFFHADEWMGGYSSYRGRLIRLAHISFFGLGFLNLFFGLSAGPMGLTGIAFALDSWSWIAAGLLGEGEAAWPDVINDFLTFGEVRKDRIVELRFFGGFTAEETAEVLGISLRTVHREWDLARNLALS